MMKWAAIFLAMICMGIAAILGWRIIHTKYEYQATISTYDRIANIAGKVNGIENESRQGPGKIPVSVGTKETDQDEGGQTDDSDKESKNNSYAQETGFQDSAKEQSISFDQSPSDLLNPVVLPEINFKALKAVNPDVIGWIYCPDSAINYPVVQGDDNDYYLKHLVNGTENCNGCPFLDVQNRQDFTDDNSIIYGHHMKNGTMFAGISWYEDQSYYDEHPVIYLMTPTATYRIELFSGYITTMDSSAYMQTFGSIQEHTGWLKEVSGKSDFRANLEISAYDRVITFSTCAYRFDDARYVLHGKLAKLS